MNDWSEWARSQDGSSNGSVQGIDRKWLIKGSVCENFIKDDRLVPSVVSPPWNSYWKNTQNSAWQVNRPAWQLILHCSSDFD